LRIRRRSAIHERDVAVALMPLAREDEQLGWLVTGSGGRLRLKS
jgi:hypothetical protein